MPKRLVLQTILLTRQVDGKNEDVRPQIGKPFDFTAAELKQLEALNPDAIGKIIAGEDPASAQPDNTISLTPEQLEKEKSDAVNAQREQMEKDIRAQVEAELKAAAPAGDKQNKTANAGGKGAKSETPSDDDI